MDKTTTGVSDGRKLWIDRVSVIERELASLRQDLANIQGGFRSFETRIDRFDTQ